MARVVDQLKAHPKHSRGGQPEAVTADIDGVQINAFIAAERSLGTDKPVSRFSISPACVRPRSWPESGEAKTLSVDCVIELAALRALWVGHMRNKGSGILRVPATKSAMMS